MNEYTFSITATFRAEDENEAREMWAEWLSQRHSVEDGTQLVSVVPS